MNKTALKNFATNARKDLMKKVEARAFKIGITEEIIKTAQIETSDAIYIDGKQLSITEKKQRDKLIQRIKEIGFKSVVEEVAYTWFNRFIALRFMEVNNYLPTKVRVLSSSNPESLEPDIIKEALSVDLDIDRELVYELKVNNKTEELFKYLIIKQCNSLNKYLPFMFETIEDFKEILFPEGLLAKDSLIREMTDTEEIPETDWENVEIIGWLYQYYIAEEKDRVIKAKKKYKIEEIPYATQLFTPDWIVRYMVQNTLGRYWVEAHPEHRDLISKWEFYLENPNPEPNFEEKLAPFINKELKVEEIKCFDPGMGSGHILVYMFDVLYEIYSRCGYMEREIPRLIIENNLYGLDIDDRACQLACFSVVMKAIQYNGRFFRSIEKDGLTLNLASIQGSNQMTDEDVIYFAGEKSGSKYQQIKEFFQQFNNAKVFGSLIKVKEADMEFVKKRLEILRNSPSDDLFEEMSRKKIIDLLPSIIKQYEIMNNIYDILVSNPPYMGNRYMNLELVQFIKENYDKTKSDLFSAFIEYSFDKVHNKGHLGFMTPFVWMFISSYEQLRKLIIDGKNISSLIQLEYSAFEEATVPICTFTLRNYSLNLLGEYIKLSDFTGAKNQPLKVIESIENSNVEYRYSSKTRDFNRIPSYTIAYWTSERIKKIFETSITLGEIAEPKVGLFTCDNDRFLRLWHEVNINHVGFGYKNANEAGESKIKWFPYNKGGKFRKWYGNNEYLVNFYENGKEISEFRKEKGQSYSLPGSKYYFHSGITWSFISSTNFGVRYSPSGFIFDVAGSSVFPSENDIFYIMAYLCSKITFELLKAQNPTMNFQVGNVANLPIILDINENIKDRINELSKENISLSKTDWDSYEVSWDFKKHPLLTYKYDTSKIENSYKNWSHYSEERFNQMHKNEEELNRIFIQIFGLQEEMTPDVDEKDITIRKTEVERDVKSFISYAVGCIFGRYSLDKEGIVFAGGKFDSQKYNSFAVDQDNILPILSSAYFEDDILSRFIDFVKVTFGEETLVENLEFIADSLGKKDGETAKEAIRRYLLNDFYKDHLQTYKKKPIYWLFTSGKQKAFNCLIYMHRYDKSTLSRIRTDYLHELQNRLDAEKKSLLSIIEGGGTAKEISNAKKELKAIDLKIEELKAYDELLHHMADMQIEINLDDGVAVNYAKFNGLLAKLD
ncbi:BREX-1 system adenine-specific DNA-methyltransferase PglX [Brevibacillus migulae]|uniref:BREX-1 system adenine-specific DNA-methyltransferase PglX n=1 Tax=Brevibacillus migulae TaxID=1644114 RepID=UPI00106E35FE|nr:BREX-1 system adenine-specific DNA-methyltransferase PglX [Brevibacillus migulae]